jgi:hypothetical protein
MGKIIDFLGARDRLAFLLTHKCVRPLPPPLADAERRCNIRILSCCVTGSSSRPSTCASLCRARSSTATWSGRPRPPSRSSPQGTHGYRITEKNFEPPVPSFQRQRRHGIMVITW